jgi:hypothetical protein
MNIMIHDVIAVEARSPYRLIERCGRSGTENFL